MRDDTTIEGALAAKQQLNNSFVEFGLCKKHI